MVKEEAESSEDTSEKYSWHFPPKQEDLIREAKENWTLESASWIADQIKGEEYRESIEN